MSAPQIHGKALTSNRILQAVADDLTKIKAEDRLTWVEVGEVLGRSDDQAAKYADGSAAMDVVAFTKGRNAWGGRFTGTLDRMLGDCVEIDAHQAQSSILKAALALSEALEDGELSIDEIRQSRTTLEQARDALEAQLSRLGPKGTVA